MDAIRRINGSFDTEPVSEREAKRVSAQPCINTMKRVVMGDNTKDGHCLSDVKNRIEAAPITDEERNRFDRHRRKF